MTTVDGSNARAAADTLAAEAAALDAADPLAPRRDEFIGAETSLVYFDGNSLGRPLRRSAERLERFVHEQWGGRLIRGWDESWMDLPFQIGDAIGRSVIGAAPGQTVVGDSTTVLLYKLIRAAFDSRHAADSARVEIVVDTDNFPTDRYLVEGIAAERGGRVRWIEVDRASGVTADALREAVGHETAVVVLSQIAYRSGYLADARRPHADRARRRSPHPVGPVPFRRIRRDRVRCVGVRPRGRLHVQVPQRRAGLPRVRLRRGATPGGARAADPGLDGQRGRLRDGTRVHTGGRDAPLPVGHAADRRHARPAGHPRADRGGRHRRDPAEVDRAHRVRHPTDRRAARPAGGDRRLAPRCVGARRARDAAASVDARRHGATCGPRT